MMNAGEGEILRAVPVEGVKETSLTVAAKERRFVPAGGESGVASSVTLRVPLPVEQFSMQPPPGAPLQDERRAEASKTTKRKGLLRDIGHPTEFPKQVQFTDIIRW